MNIFECERVEFFVIDIKEKVFNKITRYPFSDLTFYKCFLYNSKVLCNHGKLAELNIYPKSASSG